MSLFGDIGQRLQAAKAYMGDLGQTAMHPFQAINYINTFSDNALKSAQNRNNVPNPQYQQKMQQIKDSDAQFWANRNSAQKIVKQPKQQIYNQGIDPTILQRLKANMPAINDLKNRFGNEAQMALAVKLAESRGRDDATNIGRNTHAVGGFQFQPQTWREMMPGVPLEGRLDPILSNQAAKKLRDKRGWGQWEAYNNGAYKQFMDYYNNL